MLPSYIFLYFESHRIIIIFYYNKQTVLLMFLQTCMNCEFSFAGVGAGQVLRCAGVHARVFGPGIEDNEGILWVIVHKREVAALRQKHVILQQTNQMVKMVSDIIDDNQGFSYIETYLAPPKITSSKMIRI